MWGGGGERVRESSRCFTPSPVLNIVSLSLSLSLFFFLLHWVFIAECKFSLVAASEGYSLVAGCELLVLMASLVAENGPRAHKLQ